MNTSLIGLPQTLRVPQSLTGGKPGGQDPDGYWQCKKGKHCAPHELDWHLENLTCQWA